MSDSPKQPKLIRLTDDDDWASMSKQQLIAKLKEYDSYVDFLEERQRLTETGDETEELKGKLDVARRKENTLVARLANKEQEVQDYQNKIQELKLLRSSRYSNSGELQEMQLDPAINLVFQAMQKEMDALKKKVEQMQNELSTWKFTPDSQTGKKLMSKCHMLIQENDELGKVLSSGRYAKLEAEIALQKELVQEMKKGQSDLDEFLGEIDEDVEGMQGMVYMLQQQLKDTKSQLDGALERLNADNPGAHKTAADGNKKDSSRTSVKDDQTSNKSLCAGGHHKPTENHVADRTDSIKSDAAIKVEPMEVDSSDQWTTRTNTDNPSLVNSTNSPCYTSSSTDSSHHRPNTTTECRTNSSAVTVAMTNEVSASGDAKVKRSDAKKDIKHEPSTTQNGSSKRTSSLDALDE